MGVLKSKSLLGIIMVLVVMGMMIKQGFAAQHVVGGSKGWDESTDYDSWAKAETFNVGDTLVFKYTPGLHSVMELGSESEYKKCDTSNADNSMNGGNDVVKLDKPGTRYFTCGTAGHCSAGMKLKLDVVSSSSPSSSPSPSSSSPSTSSSSSSSSDSDASSTAYQSLPLLMAASSSILLSLFMAILPVFMP